MDTFLNITSTTETPRDQDGGGGTGNCVIAQTATVSPPRDMDGGGGTGNCVVA